MYDSKEEIIELKAMDGRERHFGKKIKFII